MIPTGHKFSEWMVGGSSILSKTNSILTYQLRMKWDIVGVGTGTHDSSITNQR